MVKLNIRIGRKIRQSSPCPQCSRTHVMVERVGQGTRDLCSHQLVLEHRHVGSPQPAVQLDSAVE